MPEEPTVATIPEAGAVAPETPAAPLVNSEGALREGWRDTLPEDIRSDKVFDRVSDFGGIMKSLSSAERAYGADKIAIPNEASSEAEWDTFHKAGGRPETADDYAFARPEELAEEYYSADQAKAAQDLMHSLGLSKKQADALFAFNNNHVIAELARKAQDAELAATKLQDGLYADWGNAFEQKKHLGNKAINEGTAGNDEFKARLTEKFGNDPDFIRFAANLGSKFSEAGSPDIALIPTTGDIQNQIDEAMANKAYGPDFKQHGFTKAQHETQVEKVSQLFLKKQPKAR